MADEARLNDLLDTIEQARKEGNSDVEARATAAYRRESMPVDVRAEHENRLGVAQTALADEQNRQGPTSLLHKALAAADLGLAGVSGIATPALAGAARIEATALRNAGMNTDPARVQQAILDRGYKTHAGYGADVGAAVSEGIGKTVAPVVEPVVAANKSFLDHLSPEWKAKIQDLEGYTGAVTAASPFAPGAGSLLKRSLAERLPSQVVAETAPDIARAAGLNVSPSTVAHLTGAGETPSRVRQALETVGGEHATHADNILRNRPVITDIALQDVGLPPQFKVPNTVTGLEDTLAKAAEPFAATYSRVRSVLGPGAVPVDDLATPISQIGRGTESMARVPPIVEAEKAHYLEQLATPKSGGQLLDTMSDLRSKGFKDLLSEDTDIQARGHARLEIAKLMEGKLTAVADRVDPTLSADFKKARTGFAKLYTADAARVGNDIDPQAIRKIGERAGTNTGGMQLIEHMATHFEPDLQVAVPAASNGTQIVRAAALGGGGAVGGTLGMALGGPAGAIAGALAPTAASKVARMLVRATNGAREVPQIRLGRSLERYYKDAPVRKVDPFNLEPSPGDFQAHQPPLQGFNDLDTPLAESTQNPRTTLNLKQPPGPVIQPRQGELSLSDPNLYIDPASPGADEIIAALQAEQLKRLRGK